MNLHHLFQRRPLGRVFHRLLTAALVVCLFDANERTLLGIPAPWIGQILDASPLRQVETKAVTLRTENPNLVAWMLGTPVGPWNRGFGYDPSAGGWTLRQSGGIPQQGQPIGRLAQGLLQRANAPLSDPCMSLVARAKSGKTQLVWSQFIGAQTYEIYRAIDADTGRIEFQKVGTTAGNSVLFLDGNTPNESTYLYFVRAFGPGVACDSEVASAHPTAIRRPSNYPPVIYSDPPSQTTAGTLLSYRIRASDPNPEDTLSYGLVHGPADMVVNAQSGLLLWPAQPGRHAITVEATDGRGGVDLQSFSIEVSPENHPPVAEAGPNQSQEVGSRVFLDGSQSSDPDGDLLSFSWQILSRPPGSSAALSNPNIATPSLIPDSPGEYVMELVVSDGTANSPPDSMTVTAFIADVLVPNVVGLTQANAAAALTGAGLAVGAVTTVNHPTVPAGSVISQDPVAGTSVPPATAVALVISLGPTPVLVPNVVGLTQANAAAALTGAGLAVGAVTTVNHPTVPAGSVISQDPVAGTSVPPATAVALVLSLGPTPVLVPNVVGLTQANAAAALTGAGLAVGAVTTVNHPTVPAGSVISQDPVAGTSVPPATAVALVISLGPTPVLVPNVVGLTQANAASALTGAGLAVGAVTTVNHPTVPAGSVISQDPVAGTSVPPATAVALVLSLGPTPVLVPNVVGLTQANAASALTGAGLAVGAVTTVNHPTVPAGSVISQDPVAGTSVPPATAVALVISLGPTPVLVPNVVGLTQANAASALTGAGLAVGAVTTVNHPTVPAGSVISQDPVAGTSVPPATAVALVVSLGPTPVLVPNVVGLTQANAAAALTGAGLAVGAVTTVNHPTVPAGSVISQDPVARTSVPPATAVALVLSLGPTPVLVPNVVGLTQANAAAALTGAGLTVGAVTTVNHPTVPAGSVISQDPVAGTSVPPATAVALVVSLGPTPVLVPNVVGLTQANAAAALTGAGLAVGAVTTVNHPTVPAGSVISQDPIAGTSVPPATAVALVLSLGPTPVLVPNVVGLTQANAGSALTGAGLAVGAVTTVNHPTVPAGSVISQDPVAGTSVPPATAVALVVSLGPPPVLVPDVVGLTQAEAETAITDEGLVVGVITAIHDATVPAGQVLDQEPSAGAMVAPGSSVDLVLSLGPTPVIVPNVVGLTQAAAGTALVAAGLGAGPVTTASHPTVPAGSVISQNPVAGASVTPGTVVALVVSSGPPLVIVPDVVNLTQAAAQGAILAAGLAVGAVTSLNHPTVPAGLVLSQNPGAGASVTAGTPVAIVLSLGSGAPILTSISVTPSAFTMPRGASRQFTAQGTWSDGHTEDITASVEWTSTPLAVANITAAGLATALDPGSSTLRAARDGVAGTATLTVEAPILESIVITPGASTVLLGRTQPFSAVGVFSDGTSAALDGQVSWTSDNESIATINAAGIATGIAEGLTTLQARLNATTASVSLTVRPTVADTTLPTVTITSPAANSTLTAPVDIVGTASDANFLKYTLEYAIAGDASFTTLRISDTPVVNGVLGQFDPTLLLNDLYTVRLTVLDRGGNSTSTSRTYQISQDQKIGIFTLAFQDLNLPVSGVPITITRLYDSRDKGRGDFGVGWRLDIQTTKATVNRVQGTGWRVDRSGGFFPTYSLVAAEQHKVSIKLPDGKVEEFDLTPTPGSSVLFPFQFINAAYTARAGTYGRLEPLGGTGIFVSGSQPGAVEFLDDSTFELYDPKSFRYTAPDGRAFEINTTSGVRSITDPNGTSLTIGAGGISHSTGASISFLRDAQGRITRITDPNGNFQSYAYDANGDLVSHTDPVGNTTRFLYNRSHGLLEVRDPRGVRAVRSEYNDQGRLIATIDPRGHRTEYSYDTANNRQVFQDARGNVTVEEYSATGKVLVRIDALGGRSTFTYDADGNQTSRTDPLGNTTLSTFDGRQNLTRETDPLGHFSSFGYNTRRQITSITSKNGQNTVNTFDANGNLTRVLDPLGNALTSTFDARGNRTATTDRAGNTLTYQYTASGRLSRYVDPAGRVTTYSYDANGNTVSESNTRTLADGSVVTMTTSRTFDARNRLTSESDPLGGTTTIEYGALGKETARVDKNGHRTAFEYDLMGRLVATVFPDGTREVLTYDADGNRISQTDAAGNTTRYEYDALNRLVRTILPDGAVTSTEYDAAGREIATVDPLGNRTQHAYDAAGRRTQTTDAEGNITRFEYDAQGNRLRMIEPDGGTVTYQYDAVGRKTRTTFQDGTFSATTYNGEGRALSVIDQAGASTTYQYDGAGKVTRITNALGGQVSYVYDEVGNLISQTDANGHTTTWAYDSLGRPIRHTLPLGMSERFAYDPNGNLVEHVKFDGNVIRFTYDSMNRMIQRSYPDGSTVALRYTAAGLLESETDARGTTSFEYDNRGRVTRVLHPDGREISYAYDLASNRTSVTTVEGATHYSYDSLNRLATVEDPLGQLSSYTYNAGASCCGSGPSSHRASLTYPNGTSALYSYDALHRLTQLENRLPDGSILSSYDFTLGPAGNRLRIVEDTGRTIDYTYDALYRLTAESITDPAAGNKRIDYTYDAVANRLSKSEDGVVTAYSYDANDRILSDGADTFTYDANGNTLSHTAAGVTTAYSYTFDNRLETAVAPGVDLEFAYDAAGNRVEGRAGATSIHYLVDRNLRHAQVLSESDGSGGILASYVYGADLISQQRNATTAFYHYDGLGSTRALSDPTGAVTDTYTYDAFGRRLASTGASVNHYLFTGAQLDPNLGFYYLRARYYSPDSGRFLTMDPFSGNQFDPPTLHKYAYTFNDPVNKTDPSGLFFAATMTFPTISISFPVISGAALLAFLTKAVILVTAAAVAACALGAAISGFTAIGSGNPCDITKFNIFYSGMDTPATTAHTATAIASGHRSILHRISPTNSRSWLKSDVRCNPAARAAFGSPAVCDEYPFASSAEGGQANSPSLQLTPAWEGPVQGGKLGAFYGACKVLPNDPIEGLFGVVPAAGVSSWVCK